jgi:MHS family proline/betaine transporter-like MFS transporter
MVDTQTRRSIAAGMIGNVLEWYDFAVYGFFAVTIGAHFFPSDDPMAELLAALGIFAVGYLMRPIGGIVIGHIGDHLGRRTALMLSIMMMAVPTFLIGILPGYAVLGILAPIFLTLLRMLQGLSLGGEYPSSMVFLVEHAPSGRRGMMGAFAVCGAVGGMLLGCATAALLAAAMPQAVLEAWGWRLPFLLGLPIGLCGHWLRRYVHETVPIQRGGRSPIVETVRDHWRLVVRIAALSSFTAVPFYLVFIYLVSWMQIVDGFTLAQALQINTLSMALFIPVMLAAAWLSDRYGRKPILLIATAAGFLGAFPMFILMQQSVPSLVFLGQLGAALFIASFNSVLPATIVEAVPAHLRCTAVALGFNLCIGVIGGATPFLAQLLMDATGQAYSPAILIMAAAVISFVAMLTFEETHKSRFAGSAERGCARSPGQAIMSGRS